MDKNFVKMIIKLGLFYLFVQRQRVNLLIGKRKKFMTKRWGKKSRNLSTRFFFFFYIRSSIIILIRDRNVYFC